MVDGKKVGLVGSLIAVGELLLGGCAGPRVVKTADFFEPVKEQYVEAPAIRYSLNATKIYNFSDEDGGSYLSVYGPGRAIPGQRVEYVLTLMKGKDKKGRVRGGLDNIAMTISVPSQSRVRSDVGGFLHYNDVKTEVTRDGKTWKDYEMRLGPSKGEKIAKSAVPGLGFIAAGAATSIPGLGSVGKMGLTTITYRETWLDSKLDEKDENWYNSVLRAAEKQVKGMRIRVPITWNIINGLAPGEKVRFEARYIEGEDKRVIQSLDLLKDLNQ